MRHFLYRLNKDGTAKIYGRFETLTSAKISASLLMIREMCFILSEDLSKMYFYENGVWDYDRLTDSGKQAFLNVYPNPNDYK